MPLLDVEIVVTDGAETVSLMEVKNAMMETMMNMMDVLKIVNWNIVAMILHILVLLEFWDVMKIIFIPLQILVKLDVLSVEIAW